MWTLRTKAVAGRTAFPGAGTGRRLARVSWFVLGLSVSSLPVGAAEKVDPVRLAALDRAQRLVGGGHPATGFAVLDSLRTRAEAERDLPWRDRVFVVQAALWHRAGRSAEADSTLRRIMPAMLARGDSLLFVRAAVWRGQALQSLTRIAEAESLYQTAIPLAAAIRNPSIEGGLRAGLAYARLLSGDRNAAEAEYLRAFELLRETPDAFGRWNALLGLGRVYHERGEVRRSIEAFREVARGAHRDSIPYLEANALNNLGTEEHVRGDPAAALRAYRASAEVWSRLGLVGEAMAPALNSARALAELGRVDEASAVVDSILELSRARSLPQGEIMALGTMIELQESWEDAAALQATARKLLALGESVPPGRRLKAWQAYARGLALADSAARALAVLEDSARPLLELSSADFVIEYHLDRCNLLESLGRHTELAEASPPAARQAAAVDRPDLEMHLLTLAARAELRLAHSPSAMAHLTAAARAWERLRSRPSDLEWREHRSAGRELSSAFIAAHLSDSRIASAPERVASAFDAVQRFKARTLLDRVAAVTPLRSDTLPPISLSELQRSVLREGELFLDLYEGPETTFLFAITRSECEVFVLPGGNELSSEIGLFRELVAEVAEPHDGRRAALDQATSALRRRVLGPWSQLLAGQRGLIWAPDGTWNLLPLDLLLPPEARLVTARVPSATLLALVRSQATGAASSAGDAQAATTIPTTGLVIRGRHNAAGDRLRGADAEADWLQRRFAGVVSTDDPTTKDLSGRAFLHAAAHTELDDAYPWRSSILCGGLDSSGTARRLRAEEIATSNLTARLVVLSGCESAGGRVLPGEGVLGLSTAFLAAGASTVLATLWPVEDESAGEFIRLFYGRLEQGASVGEALRQARQTLAEETRWSDPAYWAGFVLIGDPELTLPLERRGRTGWGWAAGAALLVLVLSLSLGRRAILRRRAVIPRRQGATHS